MIRLTECPRDAMQGISSWIPTSEKIRYLNALLRVGFDVLDFGSFVSEKAVPQMKDTEAVLEALQRDTRTELLAIVANERGASRACSFSRIRYIGYPFSVSETFQLRNTGVGIGDSLSRLLGIRDQAASTGKTLVVYLSMGFGNPYGDPWSPQLVADWCHRLYTEAGVRHMALSDTVGVADPAVISSLFSALIPALPEVHIGAHLHTTPTTWKEKVQSAYDAGCRSFDGALKGFGGCPMAADALTGNMPTEHLVSFLEACGETPAIDHARLAECLRMVNEIFPSH